MVFRGPLFYIALKKRRRTGSATRLAALAKRPDSLSRSRSNTSSGMRLSVKSCSRASAISMDTILPAVTLSAKKPFCRPTVIRLLSRALSIVPSSLSLPVSSKSIVDLDSPYSWIPIPCRQVPVQVPTNSVTKLFVVEELVINSIETEHIDLSSIAVSILAAFPIEPIVIEKLSPIV